MDGIIKHFFNGNGGLYSTIWDYIDDSKSNYYQTDLSALFLIMLLLNFLFMDKYVAYNINGEIARKVLPAVLDDEGISYELNEDSVLLESYNKSIPYILLQNAIDIDFQNIRKMPYSKKIKQGFFSRIKVIEKTQKSTSGPVYLLVGIGLAVFGFML